MFNLKLKIEEPQGAQLEIKKGEPTLETIISIFGSEEKFLNEIDRALNSGDYNIGTDAFTRQVLGLYWSQKKRIGSDFVKFRRIISRIARETIKEENERDEEKKEIIDQHEKDKIVDSSKEFWEEESKRSGNEDDEEFLKNN